MANKYTNRDLWEYNFNENDYANLVKSAQNKASAESAVANYGPFKYGRQQDYDNALNAKLNQGKFSYDINGDALYQQYKENYINQGKQAMMDTMGQAAAMTGGYGNSYAATVGNQTYQGYLTNLNNIIPQLQQMALDRYNAESNRLSENFNILGLDRQNALSDYESGYSKLVADRDYYGTDYANTYKNTLDLYNNQFTANNDAYWNEYNTGYQAKQDSIANSLAQKQYELQRDAQIIAEKQAGVVRDNDGKIVSVGTTNNTTYRYADGELPQHILDKLANIENDNALEDYLNELEANKSISPTYASELYASYAPNNVYIDDEENTWRMTDNGGGNLLLLNNKSAIDDDGKAVKRIYDRDKDGNIIGYKDVEYTMRSLYDELTKNGMSEKDAKKYVLNIQKQVGIV